MGVGTRFTLGALVVAALVGTGAWALMTYVNRTETAVTDPLPAGRTEEEPQQPARRITATLHYVAEDGLRLVTVTREVPFGDTTAEQARHILASQLEPAPEGLLTAIPAGVTLRGVFVSASGQAFVDFSPELRTGLPGGSLHELFTVYSIVSTLTVNLPALASVQILIDGREVDTLAGHVDLRRPLPRSAQWLEPPRPGPSETRNAP